MPRNYVPKHKTYSEVMLQEALGKLKNGEISYREAKTRYNIDKSLLWRRVHNLNTAKQGRKTVLSKEAEEDVAQKIKIMAQWGWALTRKEIRSIVQTYVVQNNIKNNFKYNYPGKDWMQLFMDRNGLVTKKLEQLEKSRRNATSDPFIIYHFYGILEKTLTTLDLLHDKPQHIYNLDETSFSADPTRIKGVTGKGQKAHRIIQGSGKENTTVMGCVSADGTLLPPLIIFKGQNLWSSWKGTQDIPGTTYACSENGWMMTSIFNEWFANFCRTVHERPLLVIFDGHVTHLDPATIELAVRENISLLKLPAHTTDLLQPMDRSCFGPIKYKWNERLIEWQRVNQRTLTKSEFCDLLCGIWRDGLSKEVIKNAFKVTGIYPVNKDAYPKDRLDPVKLDRFNNIQVSGESIPNPLNIFESRPTAISTESYQNPEPSCSFQTLLLDKIQHTKPVTGKRRKIDGKGKLLTSEEYLKSIENLDKNKRKKLLKKKEEPKKKKKKRQIAQKESDTDTDIGEEEVHYDDESDIENVSLSEILEDQQDEELHEPQEFELNENRSSETCEVENQQTKEPLVSLIPEINVNVSKETCEDLSVGQTDKLEYGIGDFILVVLATKKKNRYYVARIEEFDDDENLRVIYLKRSKKIIFVYPDVHIIYTVHKNEVVMKLPSPTQKCKRGALMFDVDFEKYHIE